MHSLRQREISLGVAPEVRKPGGSYPPGYPPDMRGERVALRAVPDHPKFASLKTIIAQPKGATMGWLEAVWHFTGRFTPQGDIGKYTDQAIEAWVEWNGEPGFLIASLIETGWLDRDQEHRLLVHDWAQHADKATKNSLTRANQTFCTPTVRTPYVLHPYEKPESSTVYRLPEPEPVPEPVPVPEKRTKTAQRLLPEQLAGTLPLVDGSLYEISRTQISEWSQAFPCNRRQAALGRR